MSIGLRVALTIVFGLTTLCISSLASAQWYAGGSAGRSTTSFHTSDFSLNLPAFISENQDKNKSAYKLFGGYDFNKNWAVEGGYTDLGKPQYNYAVYAGPQAGNTGQTIVKESAWSIAAKGAF